MLFQQLLGDLNSEMPVTVRLEGMINTIRTHFKCGAVVLLRLYGESLRPEAATGLVEEAHGRRFSLAQHPRLAAIMTTPGTVRFPSDSPLPDPYDGLLASQPGSPLPVHDCIGICLRLDGERWGALTLDSLIPEAFNTVLEELNACQQLIEAVVRVCMLEERVHALQRSHMTGNNKLSISVETENDIIGQSDAICAIKHELEIVAASDLPVLLLGETGVGKEIFASYLHRHSLREDRPMIYINCAALPENLAESELFGHVKGAFSGATSDRAGRFESADKGTLFLDEVGELPLPVQAKLLRVLQNGEIQRLGSDKYKRVDVRIVAATNRDLCEQIREKAFRADLYHRLSVYPVPIPPLRERDKDIPLLAGHFLEQNRARLGLRSLRLAADASAALLNYNWPGNVRELEHVISRAAIKALSRGAQRNDIVTLDSHLLDLDLEEPVLLDSSSGNKPSNLNILSAIKGMHMKDAVHYFQKMAILRELQHQNGSWSKTARAFGLDPSNLHKLAQKLNIK